MAAETEIKEIPVKDFPDKPELDWQEPEIPEDRHLTTDLLSFPEFSRMRKRLGGRNVFKPKTAFEPESWEELKKDPVLQPIQDEYVLASLSMEPESVLFLKDAMEMFKPKVVLELGAGLSTLALAGALEDTKYVSVDQSQDHMDYILDMAEKAGIRDKIHPLVLPLVRYKIGDEFSLDEKAMLCYDFDEAKLHQVCGGIKPDMIIIDGPMDEKTQSGASLAKTLTLPVLSLYSSKNAAYLMDGAYYDPELFAMEQWQDSGIASVVGVKAVGKGMMIALAPVQEVGGVQ